MERKTDLRAATRLVIEWRPPDALFKPQPCFLGFPHLGRGREKAKRSRDSKPCAAKSSKGIRCNRSPPFTVTVTIPKVTELPRMIIRGKVNRNSQEDLRHTQQRPKYYHDAILVLTKLMCKPIQRFTSTDQPPTRDGVHARLEPVAQTPLFKNISTINSASVARSTRRRFIVLMNFLVIFSRSSGNESIENAFRPVTGSYHCPSPGFGSGAHRDQEIASPP